MSNILTIGICDRDFNYNHLKQLYKEGFNGLHITLAEHPSTDSMLNTYLRAKEIGFTHFLIEIGQGLGPIDGNYSYRNIIDTFTSFPNITFYIDEAKELVIEKMGKSEELFLDYIHAVDKSIPPENGFIVSATIRNYIRKQPANTISSYYGQHKFWNPYFKMVWVYGQIKLFNSLCYYKLKRYAERFRIPSAYLYQGDKGSKVVKYLLRKLFIKAFKC